MGTIFPLMGSEIPFKHISILLKGGFKGGNLFPTPMKNLLDIIWKVLLSIIVILIGYNLLFEKDTDNTNKPYWKDPNFKPDTVYKEIYREPEINNRYINPPPQKVIYYREYDQDALNRIISGIRDSLISVVDTSSNDTVYYSPKFLTNYTEAVKMIDFKLSLDSLSFTSLTADGILSTKSQPLYLKKYNYTFHKGELFLRKKPLKQRIKQDIANQLVISGGIQPIDQSPSVALDYSLSWKRFVVRAHTSVGLTPNERAISYYAYTGIGYKILK